MIELPETQYATNAGGQRIAYQVLGNPGRGTDVALATSWISNLDVMWEEPRIERFLRRLATAGCLIMFDKLGSGVSDPLPSTSPDIGATVEQGAADLLTVLDAVGVERAALVGTDVGGWVPMFFAATWPERTSSVVFADCCPRWTQAPDYPYGSDEKDWQEVLLPTIESGYGKGISLFGLAPDFYGDEQLTRWMGKYERLSASHSLMMAWWRSIHDYDLRSVLAAIAAPCLVLHHTESGIPVEHGRYLADHLPSAQYVELSGSDALYFMAEGLVERILPFVTGAEASDDLDRVLLSVLFTDLVNSTPAAQRLGDHQWRHVLDDHDAVVRQAVSRWRGTIHKMTGDGVMASFDGPARAARCGLAIGEQLRRIGLDARAGVHTGEVERRGEDIGGIAVHVASRVMSAAEPGQVLTSRTVKDLTAGAGLVYVDQGLHRLKGIADEWQLYEVLAS